MQTIFGQEQWILSHCSRLLCRQLWLAGGLPQSVKLLMRQMQSDVDHSPKPPWNLINKRGLDQHVRIRVHMQANIARETFQRKKERHWGTKMVISQTEAAGLFYGAQAGWSVQPRRSRLNYLTLSSEQQRTLQLSKCTSSVCCSLLLTHAKGQRKDKI